MPHEDYADHVINDGPGFHSDIAAKSSLNFTNPHFTFPVHDHSFIHSHACIHTFIPYIQALHMQLLHHNASRRVTKR